MTGPILAFLLLFFFQSTLEVSFKLGGSNWDARKQVEWGLSARDAALLSTPHSDRAARALSNLTETSPAFLALTLLHEIHTPADHAVALAWAWVGMRFLYLPAYLSGIPGLRSTIWTLAGLCLVSLAILLVL